MSEIIIRLKCREGTFPLTVPLTCKISDLTERVSALSAIPVPSIKLLLGFPPQPIQKCNGTVEEAGLKSGDMIIAEVNSSSANVQQVKTENDEKILKHITEQEVADRLPLILRKVVPADNSCLFTSLGFVLGGNCHMLYTYV